MKTTRAFVQVPIPDEALARGLADVSEEEVPWWPVALIAPEPGELERKCHIKFDESFDNLDYLKVAVLDLSSGARVALKRHRGSPGRGADISVLTKYIHDYEPIVSEALDALGLRPDEVLWSRPHDE